MYMHVRKTWKAVAKQSALMMHWATDNGSCWKLTPIQYQVCRGCGRVGYEECLVTCSEGFEATTVFLLTSARSSLHLHVRKTWHRQRDEDTLMMCAHGRGMSEDDIGSHWSCLPGSVPGTSLLLNKRSGRYLHVRAAWATEPKGSQLALSADANAPGNLWCFEPVVDPRADGSWQHVRSVSAIARGKATAAVGPMAKFAWSGRWQKFPGHSVVAHLHPKARAMLAYGRKLVEESAAGRALLSATLPLESLHMTVCGWSEVGREESREEVRQALETFSKACSGEQFRARGVTVRHLGGGRAIRLDVAAVEPAEPFEALRRALRAAAGDKTTENPNKLHVNLGWYRLWNSESKEQQRFSSESLGPAVKELTEALAKISMAAGLKNGELPLVLPHLSNYPNMASFPHNCPDCG